MITIGELNDAVKDGLKLLEKNNEIKEVEVYASTNELLVLRMAYASNVVNNALEEAKSLDNFGISTRIHFKNGKIGFGKIDSSIDKNAVKEAFEKAKKNAINDTDFKSLPEPKNKPLIGKYHDNKIMNLKGEKAVEMAYDCLTAALNELKNKKFSDNVNMTGELDFLKEKMAIISSTGIKENDESTIAIGHLTTIFELEQDISGMWFDSSTNLNKFNPIEIGKQSVQKTMNLMKPQKLESGKYRAVLGRLAVADILYSRFDTDLSSYDLHSSPFQNHLDKKISNYPLNIQDNGILDEAIGTKKITDEGIPTQKTQIVKDGVLVNLLSDDYYAKKYSNDTRYNNANGFRYSDLGREYSTEPTISGTNLVIEKGNFSEEELIKETKKGIYIGRLWYTYPSNGMSSPTFTSTIRGDSYIIENGEIKTPLTPNTLRVNDDILNLFNNIIGLSKTQKASIAWGEKSVIVTPEIAITEINVDRIAKGLY